jgi:hypothetical protein
LGHDLVGVGGTGDGALHADDGSGTRGTGNDGILAVGEGDVALPTDDNSGALRADGDSDVLSCGSGDNATTLVISSIDADSSLDVSDISIAIGGYDNLNADGLRVGAADSILSASDVLAAIGGGAIGAICGDGSVAIGDSGLVAVGGGDNLGVDALRVGGNDSILGVGDLGTDDQCSSGGSWLRGKAATSCARTTASSWARVMAVAQITLRSMTFLRPELSRLQLPRSAHTRSGPSRCFLVVGRPLI